jgi:hypothetical protein
LDSPVSEKVSEQVHWFTFGFRKESEFTVTPTKPKSDYNKYKKLINKYKFLDWEREVTVSSSMRRKDFSDGNSEFHWRFEIQRRFEETILGEGRIQWRFDFRSEIQQRFVVYELIWERFREECY